MVSIKFLQSHSLFGGLPIEDLKRIRQLLREERVPAGQVIIHEGDTGNSLYLIHRGSVEILKSVWISPEETIQKKIAELHKGQLFGEMELIDIEPRTATVRATTSVTLCSLSGMDLYEISNWNLRTFTMIIMNLAREISRRLRKMDALLVQHMIVVDRAINR